MFKLEFKIGDTVLMKTVKMKDERRQLVYPIHDRHYCWS